jgi:hypothetical protein
MGEITEVGRAEGEGDGVMVNNRCTLYANNETL